MSKTLITSLVIFTLGLGAFVEAQEGKPRVRRVPIPTSTGGGAAAAVPDKLAKNISITVSGKFAGDSAVDVTLTGCGRQFTSEAIVGSTEIGGNEIPSIASVQFIVMPSELGYLVSYSIGTRIPVPTSSVGGGAETTTRVSIGYHDVMVSGDVRLKAGETIEIFKAGEEAVILKLVEHGS